MSNNEVPNQIINNEITIYQGYTGSGASNGLISVRNYLNDTIDNGVIITIDLKSKKILNVKRN